MDWQVLKSRDPALAQRVGPEPPVMGRRIETKEKATTLMFTIRGKDRLLHSSRWPRREAARRVDGRAGLAIHLVAGAGLGYLVEALLKVCPPQAEIWWLEPEVDLWRHALRGPALKGCLIDPRSRFFGAEDQSAMLLKVREALDAVRSKKRVLWAQPWNRPLQTELQGLLDEETLRRQVPDFFEGILGGVWADGKTADALRRLAAARWQRGGPFSREDKAVLLLDRVLVHE